MMHTGLDFRAMLMLYLCKNANYVNALFSAHPTHFNKNKEQFKVAKLRMKDTSLRDFTRH